MVSLPTGTVTFLLTDVDGSTAHGNGIRSMSMRCRHDEIVFGAIAAWSGVRPVEQGEGDSVVAAFSRATDAIAAALEMQLALQREAWPDGVELRVRIGVHTGEAVQRDEGNYVRDCDHSHGADPRRGQRWADPGVGERGGDRCRRVA